MNKLSSSRQRRNRGFTLIEMMIATAVSGILSSIAYPSFMGTVHKVRRTDALVAVMQVQSAQERWRSNNPSYGSLAEIRQPAASPSRHYDIEVRDSSANGYEVVATARGSQTHDNACRSMKLSVTGLNATYASGADSSVANPVEVNRQCWAL